MKWLDQYFQQIDGFPRPNWDAIEADLEQNHKDVEQEDIWCDISRFWVNRLITVSLPDYGAYESENFFIVTYESEKYTSILKKFLERTRKSILKALHGIASDEGFGKHVVLIFDDIDLYYKYLSYFYEKEGTYGLSSGVYLNRGYGHFAFPHQELSYAESIMAHEMTHALLAPLPIPLWLNEGMAVAIEDLVTGSAPLRMDRELYARHSKFWSGDTIQEFWTGESFSRPDEGQELSYHLARLAVHSLSQDYSSFVEFVNKAHFSDGGEVAAKGVYKGNLGDLIAQYFGAGPWAPSPETWSDISLT